MKKINNGIVFSEDIRLILNGINALDYKYPFIPSDSVISDLRLYFKKTVSNIFSKVTIIKEDDMLNLNNIVRRLYPHCNTR